MLNEFSRMELLLGKEAVQKLKSKKIAVFGIGGVGTFVVEGLVRSGVQNFVLIDDDSICVTNFNRQIHATRKTIGKPKVLVMKERILDINERADVETCQIFYTPDNSEELIRGDYDYIVDAVDTVTAKIDMVVRAKRLGIPIISSMGAGNKLDPTKFEVSDIYKTSVCPLAKVMRKELRMRAVDSLKVVYSKEIPIKPAELPDSGCESQIYCPKGSACGISLKKHIPGSVSFVPSVVGLIIAGEVIKDLIGGA